MTFAKNPKSLSSKLRPWTPLSVMNLFGHVCARALAKNALVSSIDCLKINLKVRNVSNMVILPGNDMSHMLLWTKNGMCACARDIRNCLNKLVEHKWWTLQKTRSLYLQNCDRDPPPPPDVTSGTSPLRQGDLTYFKEKFLSQRVRQWEGKKGKKIAWTPS